MQYRPCADDAGRKPDTDNHAYPGENHTCRAGENECDQLFFRGCTKEILLKYPMQHSEVHEDYLTWLQMLRAYPYAVGIDEPLLEYRLSAHGKSRNKLKSARMTYRTYRLAGYPVWKSCRMFLSYMINGLKKYATH